MGIQWGVGREADEVEKDQRWHHKKRGGSAKIGRRGEATDCSLKKSKGWPWLG